MRISSGGFNVFVASMDEVDQFFRQPKITLDSLAQRPKNRNVVDKTQKKLAPFGANLEN